jgi:hypothetical protein
MLTLLHLAAMYYCTLYSLYLLWRWTRHES